MKKEAQVNIIDVLHELNCSPKKKSSTNGGEYCSPCPYCEDGNDRFNIWPNLANKNGYKGGRFWCRVCNKSGDAISLIQDLQGLSYRNSCEKLKIHPGERRSMPAQDFRLVVAENPSDKWMSKATAFIDWCHTQLLQNDHFLSTLIQRGLNMESIKTFKLGYNPSRFFRQCHEWGLEQEFKCNGTARQIWLPPGIVVPTFEGKQLVKVKIRNTNFENELERYEKLKKSGNTPKYSPSKYVVVKGSKKCPSVYGNSTLDTLLILESELDAILVVQEAENLCFCLALGGSSQPLDLHKERVVREAEKLLFCPDFDLPGKESWDRWIKRFPDTRRILTPMGKDPTEAKSFGIDLKEWLISVLS